MTPFISLPDTYRTLIGILLFSILVAEMSLVIYKTSNGAPIKKCIPECLIMSVSGFMLLAAIMQSMPWIIYPSIILSAAVHTLIAFHREKQRIESSLSSNSVRKVIDDLPMGMCFANPDGIIVLINKRMQELTGEMLGFCPQMLDELTEAFASYENSTSLPGSCICTLKDSVYRFRVYEYTLDDYQGWKQVTAYDITRQYKVGEQLRIENEKLKEINKKLRKMYDRMNDDIREKESLELKVYVHDTIGRSILTVQDIMHSGEETRQKVQALREAVGILSKRHIPLEKTMDEVSRTAAEMGIRVQVTGCIPENMAIESLVAAAARECVTNCVKHAGGSMIEVTVEETAQFYEIRITNDGKRPEGEIVEGSGLSSLRRSVEAGSGEMSILHNPEFCLVLRIPRKDI